MPECRDLLEEALDTIRSLAYQQAMTDYFYKDLEERLQEYLNTH